MSTKESEYQLLKAKKDAAITLLNEFMAQKQFQIRMTLETAIPFFINECTITGLRKSLNVVNVVFATLALDVIKSSNTAGDDEQRQFLPVDAEEMKTAIYYLSKAIELLDPLANMIENNMDDPAVKMTSDAFSKNEIFG